MFNELRFRSAEDIKALKEAIELVSHNRKIGIIIGDPNVIVKKILQKLLNAEGYHKIQMAINPEHLLQLIRSNHDELLVFYNLNTNGFDGIKMFHEIQKLERVQPIKYVMITNQLPYKEIEAIMNLGISGYLQKPIEKKGLIEALQMAEVI